MNSCPSFACSIWGPGTGWRRTRWRPSASLALSASTSLVRARAAAFRDRPGIYDHYYVTDFCELGDELRAELQTWSFNCLVSVAALGFGDIPPKAIAAAIHLIESDGWIAFNIKESFLDASDTSGFSTFVRDLILSRYLDLHHMERYQHRLSVDGRPLNYFAIVGRKRGSALPASVRAMVETGISV